MIREKNMPQDNLILIKQIEFINECISDECQENMFYTPRANGLISERIRNASLLLLNNAMRLIRNQSPIIKSEKPLTLTQTKDLMFKIYQIMLSADFLITKENKIRSIMQNDYTLNPNDLLQPNPSFYTEELKTLYLLSGNS